MNELRLITNNVHDEIEIESVATQTEVTVLDPTEPGTCDMHVKRNVGV